MVVTIMKALCVIAFALDAFLLIRDVRAKLSTEEGRALFAEQRKFFGWNSMVGFVANFFDTLGIGSFAPSSAMIKFRNSVEDQNLPGTLNAGDAFPVLLEAFLFFDLVEMDSLTLVSLIVAATLGAYLGASVVTKWDVNKIRWGMGIGLAIVGIIMFCKVMGFGPFGITGTAVGLTGWKLIVAIVLNFCFGAFMNLGIGQYAPCMAMLALMGMNIQTAFPVMMGSSAYLMGFGNTPKFIKESRYDMIGVITQGIFGCIGVLVAYFIVKSLPIKALTILVVCVVFFTSYMFIRDARKNSVSRKAAAAAEAA